MNFIPVSVKEVNETVHFNIDYINRFKILTISNPYDMDYSFGLTLDGSLIIDINKKRELVNIELLLGSRYWKRDKNLFYPTFHKKGIITFPKIDICKCIENTKVYTRYNSETDVLMIYFYSGDNTTISSQYVSFSKNCIAIIDNNSLFGFFIKQVLAKHT